MTAPTTDTFTWPAWLIEGEARCARASEHVTRAWKITDRLLPPVRHAPHGFHERADFIDALFYEAERRDLAAALSPIIKDKIAARGHLYGRGGQ